MKRSSSCSGLQKAKKGSVMGHHPLQHNYLSPSWFAVVGIHSLKILSAFALIANGRE
jgi:hypothetical protein